MITTILLVTTIVAIVVVFVLARWLSVVIGHRPRGRTRPVRGELILMALFMLVAVSNSSVQFALTGATAHVLVIVLAGGFALWLLYSAWKEPT